MNTYLDYNATAPIHKEVLEALFPLMSNPANPSSIHKDGRVAKSLVENARKVIMNYLGIDNISHDVIFTSGGTESNNLVLSSFVNAHLFVGATEHASILKCCGLFKKCSLIPVDQNGLIDLAVLENLLRSSNSECKLVSISHANNETGVIQDLKPITDISHKYGAFLHSDMAQSLGKIPISFADLNVDIATISSHKIGGFQGASAVIKKANVQLSTMLHGGGQERGFRAGTENVYAIASFAEAVKLIDKKLVEFEEVRKLRDYMEDSFMETSSNVKIYSKNCNRLPNTSYVSMLGVDHQTQVMLLDMKGFSISAGSACSSGVIKDSHVLSAMDRNDKFASGAIRISLGTETTHAQIENFIRAWQDVYKQLSTKLEVSHG